MTSTDITPEPFKVPDHTGTKVPCPDHIPEKFWDAKAGTLRVEDLLKSYRELERRFTTRQQGSSPDIVDNPEDNLLDPETRDRILKHLGRPDDPEDYTIHADHPYITLDPALNARLHELGFTQDQVQAVYDLAVERLVPLMLELVIDGQAERDITKLVNTFGGPQKWVETARQLMAFGQKNLPNDIFESLAGTYDGVMMMHDMMQSTLGRAVIPTGTGQSIGIENLGLDRLRTLMRDPRYWRDHDPKFIDKITAGFARIYG